MWGVGCVACTHASDNNNIRNNNGHVYARYSVRTTLALQKCNLVLHHNGKGHKANVMDFLQATAADKLDEHVDAPSVEQFLAVWDRMCENMSPSQGIQHVGAAEKINNMVDVGKSRQKIMEIKYFQDNHIDEIQKINTFSKRLQLSIKNQKTFKRQSKPKESPPLS